MNTLKQSLSSVAYFCSLITSGSLHSSKLHLGEKYKVSDNKTYAVFRETISDKEYEHKEVTLIIGFRLKFIGNNAVLHWLFQRLCVLDTPLWVGFTGFKTKFWMVKPESNDYLGIYRYQGRDNALTYAKYICRILKSVSTRDSVWYKIVDQEFKAYIDGNAIRG